MKDITIEELAALEEAAYGIRQLSTQMVCEGQWGHLGGSYSITDILAALYFGAARINPEIPEWNDRDYIVLSKAHCSPALYAALALKGFFDPDKLHTYGTFNGLEGHLDVLHTPGVECSGGSLGLGLSFCVGIAGALKLQERYEQRVYCILGDGELCEGQVWEAVMAASQQKLDNLIAIIDYNKVMAKGFLYQEISHDPLDQRFRSFGWDVIEIDGHDFQEINQAFYAAKYLHMLGRPICIIAHTVKGKGVGECEFNYRWHTHAPNEGKANYFLQCLSERYRKPCSSIGHPIKQGGQELINLVQGELSDEVL